LNETTREDQRSRLDEFAARPIEKGGEIVPVASYLPPAERHGAIKVEVARSLPDIRNTISELAMMLGERGYYSWRVKDRKKGSTSLVEDVSIKGAMALMKAYRNCRVDCPVIVDLGSHWEFHAIFIDYENGIEVGRSFRQRKGIAGMGDDAARKEDMAYQIGQSKAERNVIVKALEIEAEILLEECKRSIVDRVGKDIEKYRRLIVDRAAERGVELARIEAVAGRSAKDWVAIDMVRIIGMMAAVNDGMATMDETFPKLQAEAAEATVKVDKRLDQFAATVVEGDIGPQAGRPPAAPEADAPPPSQSGAADADDVRATQEDMIFRLLRLAQDSELTVAQRLEELEALTTAYHDTLPQQYGYFVDTAINTAAKVARGELPGVAAQKYLTGLVAP